MVEPHPFPDRHTPTGSGIYYAIRFAPRRRRPDLSLVNALYRSIADIPLECSEASVAAQKLQWWQQEMQRAWRDDAQHPVAAAAARWAKEQELSEPFLEPLFVGTGLQIGPVALHDEEELHLFLERSGGVFGELMAIAAGSESEQRAHARALGCFLAEAETLAALGRDLRRNRVLLPANRLCEFGLTASELLDADESRFAPLLQASLASARARFHAVSKALTPSAGLGPLLSLAEQAERLLALIDRDAASTLLRQRTRLTPLSKLWISWRCQRKLR